MLGRFAPTSNSSQTQSSHTPTRSVKTTFPGRCRGGSRIPTELDFSRRPRIRIKNNHPKPLRAVSKHRFQENSGRRSRINLLEGAYLVFISTNETRPRLFPQWVLHAPVLALSASVEPIRTYDLTAPVIRGTHNIWTTHDVKRHTTTLVA